MKHRYTKKQRHIISVSKRISVFLFALVLGVGMVTGGLLFARPAESAVEKRELTAFPAFTWSSFWNGSWFSDISTWYSDTYPGRETLISLDQDMKTLYGISADTMVYGGGTADEIPDDPDAETKTAWDRTEVPDSYDVSEDVQSQIMEGLLVKDGAAYSGYYFSSEAAQAYIDVINRVATELEGVTNVYSILIPNGSGIMLDEETLNGLGGSNQEQAIAYYYSQYSDLVTPVETFQTLLEHNDEYLYFRTDHHWTALAAYYVYVNFCEEKGIEPESLEGFETYTFEPFVGSYQLELENADLIADSVTGYVPHAVNTMKICLDNEDGSTDTACEAYWEGPVFATSDSIDQYNQYLRFIQGDQPFSIIDNPEIEDGSSVMVVKESYGNALVPFLVDHYDKVYVVDFRYNDADMLTFCKENNVTDLIIASNIQIIASSGVASMYDAVLQ